MKSVRKRLTYANVMSSIAVFLVVAGGSALAATQLGKNTVGTKQLKNEAVSLAKISAAAKSGLKGATGPQGPAGTTGEKGDTGPRGERGEPGEAGPAVQVLPSGQTETGVWATSAGNGNIAMTAIPFFPKLQQSIPKSNEVFEKEGQTSVKCPGIGGAQAGILCVYTAFEHTVTFVEFLTPSADFGGASDTTGVVFFFNATSASGNARGAWAFTAP